MKKELIESLNEILQEFEDGGANYHELGEWLSREGENIIEALSIK